MAEEPEGQPGSALAKPAADDPEIQRIARLGQWLAAAETPNPNPQQQGAAAALRLFLAHELGLPLRAASELSMIKGRLVISAQLMRALAHREGYRIVRVKESADAVTAAVIKDGQEIGRSTFTQADAKRAGLVRPGSSWEMYPQRMLWARASTWAMRDFLPDVALGLISADEADEITGEVVTESGPAAPEPAAGDGLFPPAHPPAPDPQAPDPPLE